MAKLTQEQKNHVQFVLGLENLLSEILDNTENKSERIRLITQTINDLQNEEHLETKQAFTHQLQNIVLENSTTKVLSDEDLSKKIVEITKHTEVRETGSAEQYQSETKAEEQKEEPSKVIMISELLQRNEAVRQETKTKQLEAEKKAALIVTAVETFLARNKHIEEQEKARVKAVQQATVETAVTEALAAARETAEEEKQAAVKAIEARLNQVKNSALEEAEIAAEEELKAARERLETEKQAAIEATLTTAREEAAKAQQAAVEKAKQEAIVNERARVEAEAKKRGYIKSLILYSTVIAIAATAMDFAYRLYQNFTNNPYNDLNTDLGNAYEATKQDGSHALYYLKNGIYALYTTACDYSPDYCEKAKETLASSIDYANTTMFTPFCNRLMNASSAVSAGQTV